MEAAVLSTLEYDKIRDMLAARTGSVMGRELAHELVPVSEAQQVQKRLAETAEARGILNHIATVPLGGIRDVRSTLKKAELGAILEPHELLAVASTLYAARRIKAFFADLSIEAPLLALRASQIMVLRNIETVIEAIVNEQGVIRDDASSELLKLRREIKQAQSRVKEKLDNILRSGEYQKYFQDALVTMRGDRYVIPIKQEYRNNFPGIVHDQSASGATLFIEPMAIVNLNNDIKQLITAEKHEIERILTVVTGQIAQVAEPLGENLVILAQLDFVFAKAKLSIDMRATQPIISQQGFVNLIQARHPLIPAEHVVPIDVQLGRHFTTLLITGPNTGGKTVTLKTVGLFALMTQAGLFIPAAPDSEMPIIGNIFADIGDEQSIEQSLSTFSGHMTNLVGILKKIGADDLVLIDEIGAGTDPSEGAALAMSILEHIHTVGAKTIATTHYSELKTFAYSREGIENASVEFDIQTLRPTYRLLIGIPGSSNAFAISQRLGLSAKIIERAKALIHKEHADFETVLRALEDQKKAYSSRLDELSRLEQEMGRVKEKVLADERAVAEKKNAVLIKAQEEAAAVIRQARRNAEEIISELKEQFSEHNSRERQQAIEHARQKLRASNTEINGLAITDQAAGAELSAEALKPGMTVYVTTVKQKGEVLAVNGTDVTVQLGVLKLTVAVSACRLLAESGKPKNQPVTKHVSMVRTDSVARQIDIRGMTIEEAEVLLDKYIDDAVLSGLNEVLIIHGKGTGALRKGVKSYLENHSHIKGIRIADLNEGGTGATVARLA
ncbi:endonuclease MutS2 [Sporomusa acidovorans]|uniref:Endonuclease MutS2 n=1 Tax=Sporomusa acidovorans (strain ATCC 49682 / DSM 3132 / Mol) TaxID=1123286 RepID=A0ABZ3J4E8_SPOA4|nr:endonuclease MutS2 [Sporomusa acidovorans]OZC20911.1 endonuclease MutS2 [Sporomusa acidovorans DSM 3132]SDE60866.1 DNA mismatch repair protein MutS2 [Sporomusa acidovorans]